MKKLILIILAAVFALTASAQIVIINVGSSANDGTGDSLRVAFQKINGNFTNLVNDFDTNQFSSTSGPVIHFKQAAVVTNLAVENGVFGGSPSIMAKLNPYAGFGIRGGNTNIVYMTTGTNSITVNSANALTSVNDGTNLGQLTVNPTSATFATNSISMMTADGNGISTIRGLAGYVWPTLHSPGVMANNGSGVLSWLPITSGTGSPEGVVTAAVGALFLRTDGGAGTTLYVKQSGSGNTGWAGK